VMATCAAAAGDRSRTEPSNVFRIHKGIDHRTTDPLLSERTSANYGRSFNDLSQNRDLALEKSRFTTELLH
jgi:hypothetical protein